MNDLITPSEAEDLILRNLPLLPTISIPLKQAPRHVLAAPLIADRALPPYNRVMMDGICFPHDPLLNAGSQLPIAGLHAAGDPPPPPLPPGSCWEVMTGAMLPEDCDTVVPYEHLTRENGLAILNEVPPAAGVHIHPLGSDFAPGAQLATAGLHTGSRIAAVAATVGATTLSVIRPPRIAVLTTGDELVPPDQVPAAHQVRRSNDAALRTALLSWGPCEVHTLHLPDCAEQLGNALREALSTSDLILTCGGISRGKRDLLRPVLEELLGAPLFHGVAQRPGKPLAFWSGPPPVFALPGNPMSVLICFHRYVLPALVRMHGQTGTAPRVALARDFTFRPPLTHFLPVHLANDLLAHPRPLQNSGDFASAMDSDGFLELPAAQDSFPAGTPLRYVPWL